jgi:hypothetical protein
MRVPSTTHTRPPAPEKLERIARCSSSPVVQYDGTGAYFLDRAAPGVWVLIHLRVFRLVDVGSFLPGPIGFHLLIDAFLWPSWTSLTKLLYKIYPTRRRRTVGRHRNGINLCKNDGCRSKRLRRTSVSTGTSSTNG